MKNSRFHLVNRKPCAGLSLVELMIALALGLFLLVGVLQIFVGSKQTYNAVEQISRMQENARYAMHVISRAGRNAGYNGCSTGLGPLTNTLNNATSVAYDFSTGVNGFEAGNSGPGDSITISSENPAASGTWSPATPPDNITAIAIPGSDILVMRGPSGNNIPISKNNNSAQVFAKFIGIEPGVCPGNTDGINGLCPGDILLITDCTKSLVFQATKLQENTANPCSPNAKCVNIVHDASRNDPGNNDTSWGGSSSPENERFGPDSEILRLQTIAFFVGVSADSDAHPSLYQRINERTPQELVSGVENMQVLYGEDTDGDDVADIYRSVNNVIDLQQIVSLRVSLLLRTDDPISPTLNTQTYLLNGVTAASAITIDPFDDHRGRYVVTSTIKLRNRGS